MAKVRVTMWLDAEIVARYREGGPGWQTRLNADLAGRTPGIGAMLAAGRTVRQQFAAQLATPEAQEALRRPSVDSALCRRCGHTKLMHEMPAPRCSRATCMCGSFVEG
jgi:hypothetical protein